MPAKSNPSETSVAAGASGNGQTEVDDEEGTSDGRNDAPILAGSDGVPEGTPAGSIDDTPKAIEQPSQGLGQPPSKQYIDRLRDLGASIELDDDGHILSLVLGFTKMNDFQLAQLGELPRLTFLGIDHTQVTDMGLPALKNYPTLEVVYLGGNEISAAGIKHLSGLKNLQRLELTDLAIDDTGLTPLKGLTKLQNLNLSETEVTLAGAIAFAKGMPKLEITAPFGYLVGGQRLTMDGGVQDNELTQLKPLETLRELNLWECDQITDAGMQHLQTLSQLTTLELGYTQVTDKGLMQLAKLKNLRQLDVRETKITTPAVLKLIAALPELHVLADWGTADGAKSVDFDFSITDSHLEHLQHLPELERLNLWRCDQLTDAGMQHVAQLKGLRELNLGATNIGDDGLAWLTALPNLQRLVLANTLISEEGPAEISKLKSLVDLDLSSTSISSSGVKQLAGLNSLKSLNLAVTPIDDHIFAAIMPLMELVSLNLSETGIGETLADNDLAAMKNLRKIDLSFTFVSDSSLAALTGGGLERVELWGTSITDAGLQNLHQAKSLKHLGLYATAVSQQGVEQLQEQLPELEIVYDINHTSPALKVHK